MSDPREALVALILERFRAAETYMDLPRQAGLLADAIQSAGWTPPGEADEWRRVASEQTRMERGRAEAAEAEVARLREVAGRALVDRDAYCAERDEARQQLADLRAHIEALDILGPDESRDPDAAPMSGEEVRWRPASAVPDSADVRERVWQALRESRRNGLGGMTEAQALDHMTDAVLAVVGQGVTAERRYSAGDPDPTPNDSETLCEAQRDGLVCTWPADHDHPQHVAGTGDEIAAVWAAHPSGQEADRG